MTTNDPFEILSDHVPFNADSSSDPDAADQKAAMYKEILMSNTTIEHRPGAEKEVAIDSASPTQPSPDRQATESKVSYRPRAATPSRTRLGAASRRVAFAVTAIVCAVIGATLIPLGPDANVASAAEAAARTAQAESGVVSVVLNRAGPDGDAVTEELSFVFDGDDASFSDGFGPRALAVDGVGFIHQREWISSELYDRDRLFTTFASNLATTEGLAGLLELSDETTSTNRPDGTEVVTARIRVDAGPGQTFDATGFDNLPAGLTLYPMGNFDLDVTVNIDDGLVTELAWTVVGTRYEPVPGQGEGEPTPGDGRPFQENGLITYSGINEPQTIVAPSLSIPAEGVNEWKLLDSVTRTAMQNLFNTRELRPGLCGVDSADINLLINPLTPTNATLFEDMSECLSEAGDVSASRGIETLIEHRR